MSTANIFIIVCVVFVFLCKTVDKIIDSRKTKDTKSEFMSDLFKLQNKWSKKGEYDFAKSLNIIMEAFNLPKEEKEPETDYGRRYKKQIENLIQEEQDEE